MPRPKPSDSLPAADITSSVPGELAGYGWNESIATEFHDLAPPGSAPARVLRVDRGHYEVATPEGVHRVRPDPIGRNRESAAADAVTGDWVVLVARPGYGRVVQTILRRRSTLRRADPDESGYQVLVANIDVVLVVAGLDRPVNLRRLERFMSLSWEGGARPVIVLTKSDLMVSSEAGRTAAMLAEEVSLSLTGADTVAVSGVTGEGIADLSRHLGTGVTAALIGESGVGKSTLVNRMLGEARMDTGPTRVADSKGRHTTTTRQAILLPSGGLLIDTPGLRTVGLTPDGDGVLQAFGEVESLAAGCRFRDCGHSSEPGCAVIGAVESGELSPDRLAAYRRLLKEIDYERLRDDVRERRAEHRRAGKRYRKAARGTIEW